MRQQDRGWDSYTIVELPDNESAAAIAHAAGATGTVATKVVVLLTPEEIDLAARRSVEYRAPGA